MTTSFSITGPGFYRQRDGGKAEIEKRTDHSTWSWKGRAANGGYFNWRADGVLWSPEISSPFDLVAPWAEEMRQVEEPIMNGKYTLDARSARSADSIALMALRAELESARAENADRILFAEAYAAPILARRDELRRLNDALQESLIGTRQQRDSLAERLRETEGWLAAARAKLEAVREQLSAVFNDHFVPAARPGPNYRQRPENGDKGTDNEQG